MRKLIAAAVLLATANIAGATEPLSAAETKFREQMGLVDYQSVEYRDKAGAVVSFAEFQKLMPGSGISMEKKKSDGQASAVIKLQAHAPKAYTPKYKIAAGAPFPDFKLNAADGSVVDNEALRGRHTLVSFYFADCAPCIKEVPLLNEFAANNKEYGALAITFDSNDEVKKFAQRTNFSWRTLPNARELIGKVGVNAYPTMALLDPQGMVVAINIPGQGMPMDKWVKDALASQKN